MVLVSFALVVAAAITLVIGLLQSGLTLIYISIGCSVVAGVVLAIAVLRGRPEDDVVAARPQAPPAPASEPAMAETQAWQSPPAAAAAEPEPEREPEYATAGGGGWREDASGASSPTDTVPDVQQSWGGAGASDEQIDVTEAPEPSAAPDGEFPIENYERLRASEIIPLLSTLNRDQLEAVREREASGMNRFTVMSRVDAELAAVASSDSWEVSDDDWTADEGDEGADDADTAMAGAGDVDEVEPGDSDLLETPMAAPAPARTRKATIRKAPVRKVATSKTAGKTATGRKAAAKKAPAVKAGAAKSGAGKVGAAKKAGAKKTVAKKTVAKAPASAKAATPVKKSGVKKAGPGVKKVAKKR